MCLVLPIWLINYSYTCMCVWVAGRRTRHQVLSFSCSSGCSTTRASGWKANSHLPHCDMLKQPETKQLYLCACLMHAHLHVSMLVQSYNVLVVIYGTSTFLYHLSVMLFANLSVLLKCKIIAIFITVQWLGGTRKKTLIHVLEQLNVSISYLVIPSLTIHTYTGHYYEINYLFRFNVMVYVWMYIQCMPIFII